MRNYNRPTQDQEDELFFTSEQEKAIKAVDRAMKKAHKVGVEFWDNYGTLTAYNANKITHPDVTENGEFGYESGEYNGYIEEVYSKNFYAGNADDPLSYDIL